MRFLLMNPPKISMRISKIIPREVWIVLITLNVGMFGISAYLGSPQQMIVNFLSGTACYLAMRLNSED